MLSYCLLSTLLLQVPTSLQVPFYLLLFDCIGKGDLATEERFVCLIASLLFCCLRCFRVPLKKGCLLRPSFLGTCFVASFGHCHSVVWLKGIYGRFCLRV